VDGILTSWLPLTSLYTWGLSDCSDVQCLTVYKGVTTVM